MKYIAHRGNIFGPNIKLENSPDYIMEAIHLGYDVEADIWIDNKQIFLGHDYPQYKINSTFIDQISPSCWFHCKNKEALENIKNISSKAHYFWHQTDDYAITSKGYFWVYPGKEVINNSIILFPENIKEYSNFSEKIYGICSDYISKYKH